MNLVLTLFIVCSFSCFQLHYLYTVDRTPPSLTFVSNPTQVNDNETFSMTWTVSESLSMEHCNLTTPASSSIVNCRGSYSQNILIPGNYAISIKIEDLNGNKAGPYEHIWVVSTYFSMHMCIGYVFFFLLNKMLINNIYVFIVDVTPPSLRFVLNHSLTRSNASITWTVSEPVVSSNCTVTFPNGTLVYESCIDRWEAIDLRRGPYQISIVLVDTAGHIGGPFRHTWTNSMYMLIMISLSYAGLSRYFKVYTGNFVPLCEFQTGRFKKKISINW